LAVGLFPFHKSAFGSESTNDFVISSFSVTGNQGALMWSGGRPTYQVQTRSAFTANWVNIGSPTSNNFAVVPVVDNQTYFRIVSDFTARYQVVFRATWSQTTHPSNWPANAHWSGLVGGTHNDAVHFFRAGETASEGIRLMAERGQQATLLSEIARAIGNPAAVRAVGSACGANPVALVVPCHRAVRTDGGLGGYAWGIARKKRLLELEKPTKK